MNDTEKPIDVTEWPIGNLTRLYISLYNAIEIADKYDDRDLELYYAIEHELNKRGYDIVQQPPKIEKRQKEV